MDRTRLDNQNAALLFVCVCDKCRLGFSQPNHNRKKQPSCRQKQSARRLFWQRRIPLRLVLTDWSFIFWGWLVIIYPRAACRHIAVSPGDARWRWWLAAWRRGGREEGVPAAWRQTLLSFSVTHPSHRKLYAIKTFSEVEHRFYAN